LVDTSGCWCDARTAGRVPRRCGKTLADGPPLASGLNGTDREPVARARVLAGLGRRRPGADPEGHASADIGSSCPFNAPTPLPVRPTGVGVLGWVARDTGPRVAPKDRGPVSDLMTPAVSGWPSAYQFADAPVPSKGGPRRRWRCPFASMTTIPTGRQAPGAGPRGRSVCDQKKPEVLLSFPAPGHERLAALSRRPPCARENPPAPRFRPVSTPTPTGPAAPSC